MKREGSKEDEEIIEEKAKIHKKRQCLLFIHTHGHDLRLRLSSGAWKFSLS